MKNDRINIYMQKEGEKVYIYDYDGKEIKQIKDKIFILPGFLIKIQMPINHSEDIEQIYEQILQKQIYRLKINYKGYEKVQVIKYLEQFGYDVKRYRKWKEYIIGIMLYSGNNEIKLIKEFKVQE